MRLFDIVAELRDNIARIEASETPDDSLLDSLDDTRYSLQDKLRACIGVARELDADAAFAKAESARIAARGKSCEAQADRLRSRVFEALQATGLPLPLRFAEFTVSMARNAPSAEILDDAIVPVGYWREIPASRALDRKAILDDLKSGVIVAGAKLAEPKSHLIVK